MQEFRTLHFSIEYNIVNLLEDIRRLTLLLYPVINLFIEKLIFYQINACITMIKFDLPTIFGTSNGLIYSTNVVLILVLKHAVGCKLQKFMLVANGTMELHKCATAHWIF